MVVLGVLSLPVGLIFLIPGVLILRSLKKPQHRKKKIRHLWSVPQLHPRVATFLPALPLLFQRPRIPLRSLYR